MERFEAYERRTRRVASGVLAALFGDRTGLALFAGALVVFGLTWRVGILLSDSYTVANTLVAAGSGDLSLTSFPYGDGSGTAPGLHVVDGRVYGRNYGQVFLALPVLWALQVATRFVEPGPTVVVAWSAALFVVVRTVVERTRLRRRASAVGGAVALAALGANLALYRPLPPGSLPIVAIQTATATAAALVVVVTYRLVERTHGRRVGVVAGVAVVLATPVGFWATVPKRHSLTALLALLAVYYVHRSRTAGGRAAATRFRALAYVPVGVALWVHAPEGLVLLVATGVVDAVTARWNGRRDLLVVGVVFAVAVAPALVTNALISGDPFQPPRLLAAYSGPTVAGSGAASPGRTAGGSTPVATLLDNVGLFAGYLAASTGALLDPGRLSRVFVRGGVGLGLRRFGTRPVNLAVLEAMPLAGALLGAPALLYDRASDRTIRRSRRTVLAARRDPARATDALVLAYVLLLVTMYAPRLPVQSSFTVRYLHPLYPLGVYLLVRLPAVRRTVKQEWRLLAGTLAVSVVAGGCLLVAALALLADGLGSAVRLHAKVALAGGAVALYWSTVAALAGDGYERAGAVVLGASGASTTLYLLLSAWLYFTYGERFAIPVVRLVAGGPVPW